jgi:hypothetical protein
MRENFLGFNKLFGSADPPAAPVAATKSATDTAADAAWDAPAVNAQRNSGANSANSILQRGWENSAPLADPPKIKPTYNNIVKMPQMSSQQSRQQPRLQQSRQSQQSQQPDTSMDLRKLLKQATELKENMVSNSGSNNNTIFGSDAGSTGIPNQIPLLNTKLQPAATTEIQPETKDYQKSLMQGACKFLSSDKCTTDYPIYMGASISTSTDTGLNLTCNGATDSSGAAAIAAISGGSISKIYITDAGNGYTAPPKILITGGDGTGAQCKAILDQNGKIQVVEVVSGGVGYSGTPDVKIDHPTVSKSCHLCCKKNLFG